MPACKLDSPRLGVLLHIDWVDVSQSVKNTTGLWLSWLDKQLNTSAKYSQANAAIPWQAAYNTLHLLCHFWKLLNLSFYDINRPSWMGRVNLQPIEKRTPFVLKVSQCDILAVFVGCLRSIHTKNIGGSILDLSHLCYHSYPKTISPSVINTKF